MSHDKWHDNEERLRLHSTVLANAHLRPSEEEATLRTRWEHAEFTPEATATPGNWTLDHNLLADYEFTCESGRCLKCADSPCSKGCPSSVDPHAFIYSLSKQDVYQAARLIYSENPLGLTCGLLCSTQKQCQSACNLRGSAAGPIDIGALQRFACEQFLRMQVPLVRPEQKFSNKIAIAGSGPASISCATFLSRLGYENITIYEKSDHPGGVPSWIPEYRIPYEFLRAEIALAEEMGVKIQYNSEFGTNDLSLTKLKENGVEASFLGCGLAIPFSLPFLTAAEKAPNFWTAASFLSQVAKATKDLSLPKASNSLPRIHGNVLILGGGDVAFNCAGAALRCGAKKVILAFREDLKHRPCGQEELLNGLLRTGTELLPCALPVAINHEKPEDHTSPVVSVVLQLKDWDNTVQSTFTDSAKDGNKITARCDAVIVAFGNKPGVPLAGLETTERGLIKIDPKTGRTSIPWVFAGGDSVGSTTVVRAVNDGKTAAWFIHKMIQESHNAEVSQVPLLPPMKTVIDNVDISVDLLGLHFINPFGLSSATPTGSIGQIRRAFEMGWGFAVAKTMIRVPCTNVSPRIASNAAPNPGACRGGFVNIELVTEKTVQYWVEGIKILKRDFPKHIVICSVMAPAEKSEWEFVGKAANESGADAIELNLSCPHVGRKGYGMLAGQSPEMVKEITSWVRAVTKLPLIVKLTPNITDITQIAIAAKEGGADAVTAINTVSGIIDIRSDGHAYPRVGTNQHTAYGGVSGNYIRPMALKAVSAIKRTIPDLPILATGGCDSAESALQFIHAGAPVIQITSAIQNQDYSIIDELVYGLKALLYMKGRPDLSSYRGQIPSHETLPNLLPRNPIVVSNPPKISDLVGRTAPEITVVPSLDVQYQVRANVDESHCLRCGKCYMSCNDTGYHAIEFDSLTHIPHITDDCMGCGLCASVCPGNCITYVKKTKPHMPFRGIPDPSLNLPFDP